jgi:hypothetical protein
MPLYFAPGGDRTPPHNSTETVVDAWAHCGDARCRGYGQQRVKGVRTVVEHTIGSRGGDGIFVNIVENSYEYLRFADPEDGTCVQCGKPREVSLQERPVYQGLSGFPQHGLLNTPAFDPNVRNTQADERAAAEMAELRKQIAELSERVAGDGVA